jgi:UDP-N-acetylglucosamine 2-epimerase (non-hydrolysing)
VANLGREGLAERTRLIGDVMVDACRQARDRALGAPAGGGEPETALGAAAGGGEGYLVATIHRAENTDDPRRLAAILDALAALPVPVVLLAHPRLRARAAEYGIELERGAVRLDRPLPYAQMVAAVHGARGVVTDSGGLQKESYLLERPCTTIRTETEWSETTAGGWNVLVHPDEVGRELQEAVMRATPTTAPGEPYGDGKAAERAIAELEAWTAREAESSAG